MRRNPTPAEFRVLEKLVNTAARRLVRSLGVPRHELPDILQELYADLIARFPRYDAGYGALEPFAATVVSHCAARIAGRVLRHRRTWGKTVSLHEPAFDADGAGVGDLIAEEDGLWASLGGSRDAFADADLRLDVEAGLLSLECQDRKLAQALAFETAHALARAGLFERSDLYRRIGRLRLELLAVGVGLD